MEHINLTPRLQCVANCIEKCNILADIGTDHAYIPIYAIQKSIAQKAIASDVVEGPLKIATENIHSHELQDKIFPCLANGLESAGDADIIVIAGMGGKLICDIIKNNLAIAKKANMLILQPMTCSYELRKFLHENKFAITKECLAREEDKIYNVMVVKPGEEFYQDDFFYHIGIKLFENKDPLLAEYIRLRAKVIKKQLLGVSKSNKDEIKNKSVELKTLYERFVKEADSYDKSR
ncbi:MAG: class I SAM-dependent methyltransferase [Clostridia bacterium]|nr:class I SAM-dependent methyltransferase [Clostridia bacterium]